MNKHHFCMEIDNKQKLGIPVAQVFQKYKRSVVFFLSCLNIKAGYNN